MSRLGLALLLLASSWVACAPVTSRCKEGTLFVSVTLTGAAEGADQLVIDVAQDGGTPLRTTLAHDAGATSGGVQVEFPSGYPKGHAITITIQAMKGGATIAMATGTAQLTGACESLALTVAGAPLPDLRVAADLTSGPDLLPPPPDGADLANDPNDLAIGTDDLGEDDLSVTTNEDLSGASTDLTGVASDLTVRDLMPLPAVLAFVVGTSDPTPPNPAPYGTINNNLTRTFTVMNTGAGTSSSITMFKIGGDTDKFAFGVDNCSGNTLGPTATCTVALTFLAGQSDQVAGTYSMNLQAQALNGGTASNGVNGTAAYAWSVDHDYGTHYQGSFGSSYPSTPPSGACTTKGEAMTVKFGSAPAGLQLVFQRQSSCDGLCTGGNLCYESASSAGLVECPSGMGGKWDFLFEASTTTGSYGPQQTCFPAVIPFAPTTTVYNVPGPPGVASFSCDTGVNSVTREYKCR